MKRARLALCLGALVACKKGSVVEIEVDTNGGVVHAVDHFHIVVTNDGRSSLPIDLSLPGRPVDIPPTQTFSLSFPPDRTGATMISLDAVGAAGQTLATTSGTIDLQPGELADVKLHLPGGAIADGGTGDLPVVPHWVKQDSGLGEDLNDVLVTAGGTYIVGGGGTILYREPGTWTRAVGFNAPALSGIGQAGLLYAVGLNGAIFRSNDGRSWTAVDSMAVEELFKVWGAANGEAFIAAGDAMLYSANGTGWTHQPTPATQTIVDVWGSSLTDVYAVPEDGTVLHTTDRGMNWVAQQTGVNLPFYAIDGSGPNNIFVGGAMGTILHSDGSGKWTKQSTPTTQGVGGIWVRSDQEVFAVGTKGLILHTVDGGKTWVTEDSGTQNGLNAVGGYGDDVYAVGANGTILHRE